MNDLRALGLEQIADTEEGSLGAAARIKVVVDQQYAHLIILAGPGW